MDYNRSTGTYTLEKGVDSFISLGLKITGRCNLSCYHCCAYGSSTANMSLDNAKQIIDYLAKAGLIRLNIAGGEPFLHSQLGRILFEAKNSGISTGLSTNLTQEIYDAGALGLLVDNVKTSILGIEKFHDAFVGLQGAYKRTFLAIDKLVAEGIPVFVQMAIVPENKEQAVDIATECEKHGVSRLSFYSIIKQGKGISIPDIHVDEVRKMYDMALMEKEKKDWSLKLAFIDWEPRGQYILVMQNGDLTANPVEKSPGKSLVIGNLLESSVEELWSLYPFKGAHLDFYRAH